MSFTIDLNPSSDIQSAYKGNIYWCIITKNEDGGFCHVAKDGTLSPMTKADNNTEWNNDAVKNCNGGNKFANYCFEYSDVSSISFDDDAYMNSGVIYISLGNWFPICVNTIVNGQCTGYAPPAVTNPGLQGFDMLWQMAEFTYNKNGNHQMNADTSSVDAMGFPIKMTLTDSNGTQVVGFSSARNTIIDAFSGRTDYWKDLITSDGSDHLRVISPANAAIAPSNQNIPADAQAFFNSMYDDYINKCWSKYSSSPLTMYISGDAYTGQVTGNTMNWYAGTSATGDVVLALDKPTTLEVLQCAGTLKTGNTVQKNIKKFVAAALYRSVFDLAPTNTQDSWSSDDMIKKYYTQAPINHYAKILHANSMAAGNNPVGNCYAFAFDDVCNQSSSVVSTTMQSLALAIPSFS